MKAILSVLSAAVLLACQWVSHADTNYARITGIRIDKTNVVVDVDASAALAKVTLESSTRVGRKAWEPRGVHVLDPGGVGRLSFTFTVPISPALEILRVRGDFGDQILPPSFYGGTNKFVAATGASGAGGGAVFGPAVGDKNTVPTSSAPTTTDTRTVTESDIWKLDQDTLYFFNQNRGLQVMDVSNPDNPVITGTYDLAASGEDMYLLDHTHVALLAQDNCSWYGNSAGSRVILLEIKNGAPQLVKELPVSGYIAESRLVGTALYVVANSYEQQTTVSKDGTTNSTDWQWGTRVVSFDLSDFASATVKSKDWVGGYGNVIYATDQYLFVAQTVYDNRTSAQSSVLNSYDISAPDGTFSKLASFNAPGAVLDKFKMQVNGDVFSVVLQINSRQPRASYLKTYSLANPKSPQPLAEVKIVENEQLFATRFDGNRLYVVTYFVIDPLWIFDLSDPAAPKRVGELQIPGWSTFLQPLGDKLLAIGLDRTNGMQRTAVQLFDVADPANPSLLTKVLIGDQWSDSEANWDEKAFGVLPDDHLVLVPFWASGNDGYTQGVQLIDLNDTTLVKRGVVTQNMGARRATLHRGRILSLSSQELLTVDVTDRDHPAVVKSTELSWEADRVHLAGDYLIEVDASGSGSPVLRVVKADDPATLLRSVSLKGLPYLGSTLLDGKLLVLQGKAMEVVYPQVYNPTNYFPIATNPAVLLLSQFDLAALPELPQLNSTTREGGTNYFYGQYEAISVKPDVLVWRSKNSGFYPYYGGPILADAAVGSASLLRPIWWGGAAGHFIAVDPGALKFSSELFLSTTNGWWNFGAAYALNGKIYTSHQGSEFDPTIDPPPYESQCYDNASGTWKACTIDPPPGVWVQRYYLDVIDYGDPTDPLVRPPVNLPGTMIGLAHNGELLYTRGYNIKPFDTNAADETISACSFDGVAAHLITSMGLGQNWPRVALGNGDFVYLGVAPSDSNGTSELQTWTLGATGKFELVSSQTLDSPAQQLQLVKDFLVAQTTDILLFDARAPGDLKPLGAGRPDTCYGVQFDAADGDVSRGLWVPTGWYGVLKVPVKSSP